MAPFPSGMTTTPETTPVPGGEVLSCRLPEVPAHRARAHTEPLADVGRTPASTAPTRQTRRSSNNGPGMACLRQQSIFPAFCQTPCIRQPGEPTAPSISYARNLP